jgi:hypothetical protein
LTVERPGQRKRLPTHRRFTLTTKIDVYFCDPPSPWQRARPDTKRKVKVVLSAAAIGNHHSSEPRSAAHFRPSENGQSQSPAMHRCSGSQVPAERRARVRVSSAAATVLLEPARISGPAEKLCSATPRRGRRRIKIVRLFRNQCLRSEN